MLRAHLPCHCCVGIRSATGTDEVAFNLKIDAEHKPRLVALESNEIEGRTRSGRTSPGLKAPGGCQPGVFRQLEICGWADKQRLACEFVETDAFVFPQIARFTADQEARTHLRHQPERRADGGFLLRCPRAKKARPIRLINQVESRDG